MAGIHTPGVAIVGTGFGVLTHLRAARAAGLEVPVLVGRNAAKAADRAAQYDVPHATTSLEEALALPGVHAVTVATPPHTHADITLAAIAAGKHVLCEKPFARDRDQAQVMLNAAEAAGVIHLLGTEWRFGTGQALLTRTVRAGTIGEPRHAVFTLQLPTHADPGAHLPDWWQRAEDGGGWLGAYGSHVIDQVRSTLGEFEGVSATLQRLSDRPTMTADDTYTVHARLHGGASVVLHSSCAARGRFTGNTKIDGTLGAAWLQGEEVWVDTGDGPRALPAPEDLPLTAPEPPAGNLLTTAYDLWHSMGIDLAPYTRVYQALRDRMAGQPSAPDPCAATFADGVACQAVLDAIRASSAADSSWTPVTHR